MFHLTLAMQWYWYVVIVVGVALLGYLKLTVFKKMQDKKRKRPLNDEEEE